MIHKYSMNGLHIVLDVNSGAVHIVDKVVYDVLDFYKDCSFDEICEKLGDSYSEQELKEACIEIEQLEKDKMLFSEDVYAQVIPTCRIIMIKRHRADHHFPIFMRR